MSIDGDQALPQRGADALAQAFDAYQAEFRQITRRAQGRFERREWRRAQDDAVERLDLYKKVIDAVVADLQTLLADQVKDKSIWAQMKQEYARRMAGHPDLELAETFFNSATRRIFATVGVDANVEFVNPDFQPRPSGSAHAVYRSYERPASTRDLVARILGDQALQADYEDLERDAQLAAEMINAHLQATWGATGIDVAEVVQPIFYRNKGAYIVGRLCRGAESVPLVLALLHGERGIIVDAVLLTEDEVSILFSFTRSYFHVEIDRPGPLIAFLKSIMPHKPVSELYISIGYNKHGKTEFYRELLRHLRASDDIFQIAPGEKGMVMTVFTMPSFDVVFKVIKDRFAYPKTTTRHKVIENYQLVFKHDRVGRLVDAQEFEHLRFDRDCFSEELLTELQRVAANSVTVDETSVAIKHLYTERRLVPLNLYLKLVDEGDARDAIIDYGKAVKELASANIFPGDLLLKNFGVTRHGRVVFYDYDELCLLTDCNFRRMPQPRSIQEEFSAEVWFAVGENDIFPEEFGTFLGLQGRQREVFLERHADLFDEAFWTETQERLRAGDIMDVIPYRQSNRLIGDSRLEIRA
jgi:isocitrate dehydrogenase kinase/phosphatase